MGLGRLSTRIRSCPLELKKNSQIIRFSLNVLPSFVLGSDLSLSTDKYNKVAIFVMLKVTVSWNVV